jgi:S-adenosylmethionine:tRNA ribosyltransferase-isomerase
MAMETAEFHYDLPESAIGQEPAEPRDAARLLDADAMTDHRFADLPDLLEPGDLVVVNRTRVRAGRLRGVKQATGGSVEALLLDIVGTRTWRALVRPARRLRPGTELRLAGYDAVIVAGPDDGVVEIEFEVPADVLEDALEAIGEVPLPPYISSRIADPERYQTVFSTVVGSAAAPTAGLHVTRAVLDRLAQQGIGVAEIELVVGLDTFRPIGATRVEDHRIHTERYAVPGPAADAVAEARRRGGRVVAIGTTVARTLETVGSEDGTIRPGSGVTDLYIVPGYSFRVVDRLVTNFHVPGSTLVVLIAAFMGDGWRDVYDAALERSYRFLSFGDAMIVNCA